MVRLGIPTASDFTSIMTNSFKLRDSEGVRTYIYEKAAEKWHGKPLPSPTSWAMDQGNIIEEYAIPFYQLEFNERIRRVAFVSTDDKRCGCSPDGLIGDNDTGGGIEIKSPYLKTHVKYLIEGKLPSEYVCQVQGSMYVTGRKWWRFMSYYRGKPPFVLTVKRDEEVMKKIDATMGEFYEQFDEAYSKLEKYK